jgi:hypothetical protein
MRGRTAFAAGEAARIVGNRSRERDAVLRKGGGALGKRLRIEPVEGRSS